MSFPDTKDKVAAFQAASVDLLKRVDQLQRLSETFEQQVVTLTAENATLAGRVGAGEVAVAEANASLETATKDAIELRKQVREVSDLPNVKKAKVDNLREQKRLIEAELTRLEANP